MKPDLEGLYNNFHSINFYIHWKFLHDLESKIKAFHNLTYSGGRFYTVYTRHRRRNLDLRSHKFQPSLDYKPSEAGNYDKYPERVYICMYMLFL